MKTLVTVLIIASFLQSTILPINLVLIILICRSYIKSETALFLAIGFGLFIGFLNLNTLGFTSIVYLILVQITKVLSKVRLAGNPLLIVPLTFILLSINQLATSFFNHESFQLFPKVLLESLLSLPVFYLIKLWEERFIIRKEIKLKI